ncbi:MAG: hypothetical protein ACKVIW_00270 [bacterium]
MIRIDSRSSESFLNHPDHIVDVCITNAMSDKPAQASKRLVIIAGGKRASAVQQYFTITRDVAVLNLPPDLDF